MPTSTLLDRTGSLVVIGFDGTQASALPADLIAECGGVILFKRNITSAVQLQELVTAISAIPRKDNLPPLIAIDQEGGTVSRLAGVGTTTPSAMALGAVKDPQTTERMYRLIGDELAALGVTIDLAPVADVNNNPDNPGVGTRSFGDDPNAVSLHVRAAIRGLHAAGVAATAKHFPGHGDTTVDSHLDLPSIAHDPARMRAVELAPFSAAIAERVDLIMTAHVLFPAIELDGMPATLSRAILTGLLREELQFEGVICTDCMEMEAIAARFTPEQAALGAISAGADLVLFSHSAHKARAAVAALRTAASDGRIPEAQVQRSLERVDALRTRLAPRTTRPTLDIVGGALHREEALQVARRAITIVRDPHDVIPLKLGRGDKIFVVIFAGAEATAVENPDVGGDCRAAPKVGPRYSTAIGAALGESPARIHEQIRSLDPSGHEYKQLLMAAGSANAIVAVTSRAKLHPLQARAVEDLALLGKRVIAVLSREPYDANVLPPEMTVVATYGDDPLVMRAAAEIITGAAPARGKLPISLKGSATSQTR